MKTYLITGGAGFFGSILKEHLVNQGHQCVSIDLEPDDFKHPLFTAVKGDIRDKAQLDHLFSSYNFDAVFHCAALLAHVKKDLHNLWSSNVEGTRLVAQCAKEHHVSKLVFLSSNCLYSHSYDYLVPETEEPCPAEIYGKSKLEGEKILLAQGKELTSIIFRCPTIIDEGRLGLLGILFQFIDENRKLWMVGDGENKYQFIYAKDLVQACISALDCPTTEVFNIGSDDVKSFNEVYEYVIKEAGSSSKLVHLPKWFMILGMKVAYWLGLSPLGPYQYKMISANFVFDTTKIKQKLGFKPTLTNEGMLLKSYLYYHQNKQDILNRKNVSAHKSVAAMGIIRVIKFFS